MGRFSFDAVQNISSYDDNDSRIMGLRKGNSSYNDVLKCIDIKSKTMFEELLFGDNDKKTVVTFPEVQLANGNIVVDRHFRKFDVEGNLISLEGFTRLVKVA